MMMIDESKDDFNHDDSCDHEHEHCDDHENKLNRLARFQPFAQVPRWLGSVIRAQSSIPTDNRETL